MISKEAVLIMLGGLFLTGCPYPDLSNSGADLIDAEYHQGKCSDAGLNPEYRNGNIDLSVFNQNNGARCSVTILEGNRGCKVEWKDGLDRSGSCQYLIPFQVAAQVPCNSSKKYLTYNVKASWPSGGLLSSGAAVRIFVYDSKGRFIGGKSATLKMDRTSECIDLGMPSVEVGSVSALLVLTSNKATVADLGSSDLPSVRVSDLNVVGDASSQKCTPLEPL